MHNANIRLPALLHSSADLDLHAGVSKVSVADWMSTCLQGPAGAAEPALLLHELRLQLLHVRLGRRQPLLLPAAGRTSWLRGCGRGLCNCHLPELSPQRRMSAAVHAYMQPFQVAPPSPSHGAEFAGGTWAAHHDWASLPETQK
jgi:hypothetical protein